MKPRTAINIGAIIAAITAAIQFLPQLVQIVQQLGPLIEQLKQLFSANTGSMTTFGAAAGVLAYQGYASYRERSGVARGTLQKNNTNFAAVLTELAAMPGPEAARAVALVTSAMALQVKAGASAMAAEAAANAKATPEDLQKQVNDLTTALGAVVQSLRDVAKSKDEVRTEGQKDIIVTP